MVRVLSLSAAAAVAVLASSTAALDQKLYGINYDLRQGPDWDPSKCKSADTIASDLKVLSTITSNVRTYSLSDCDVSGVLTAAKKLSLTVWLGVWVSEDSKVYDNEVKAFKELISAGLIDSNVVGINVGSEAVYREDITAEQAIEYVTDFRKVMADNDISVPVSITDIVDTFVQYPDMLKAGDIVTINQFPFWEKTPANKGAAQFNKRIQPLLKLAGDMEVIISETGWPTGGTATNGSVASEENAAIYLNDFYELAEAKKWKYYYFAGFDTPYKEKQADDATTVESHFGIFDETGTMKSAYADLKFTKTGDYSTSSGSSTTTSSGSSSEAVGTVSPGGSGTSTTTSSGTTGTTGTTGTSDATTSSSNTDTTSSATTADSGSSQLMAASLAACLGVVSTMLWSL
ncbi:putative endo-1,3-beta-glucanase [Phytophthora sojae]|uniref:glucan endo-1,3-beta-D-glucosidase n=1 Tax=Phytophthora sojae (strain P6497) TaxID=1094619 RepID=G4ZNE7_PHYSP|nr:putative endo-1,3-beta-glucanase [Phytophthora sojae]EGZ16083.1 putative endo-1,3-beta-glucanase [Phytophthora sojae]|eukprot:XP_009529832.1 putative endo-1,3-beta-glucanase [Phytophthora sojae]